MESDEKMIRVTLVKIEDNNATIVYDSINGKDEPFKTYTDLKKWVSKKGYSFGENLSIKEAIIE